MANKSIFDRAQALRSGSRTPPATSAKKKAEGGEAASTTTVRRAVRRRNSPETSDAAPAETTQAAPRVVARRRGSAPDPVDAPAVTPEPTPEPVVATPAPAPEPIPEPEPVPVVEAAAPAPEPVPAPEPAPVAEAAPVAPTEPPADGDDSPPSIEALLSTPRRSRKHQVLSAAEIAADEVRRTSPGLPAVTDADVAAATDAAPVAVAAAAEPEPETSNSLEDLLRDQGIVQHVPKKGRRIIEDDISRQIASPTMTETTPAPPTGPSLLAPEPKRNKPIRFLDPATLNREKKGAPVVEPKAKRKSIVSRRDALYGAPNDRRRRKGRSKRGSGMQTELTTPAEHKRVVKVEGTISVADLAHELGIKGGQLIKILVGMGQMVSLNERLDVETATIVAEEFEFQVEDTTFDEDAIIDAASGDETEEDQEPRAPVVTIMGHVDHGKTTLLDSIRNAKVADGEAGGITQHISAFDVKAGGERIVFIDTPGHEAFTAMRARGAQITDIVVLVVAATDGVMPQTLEVISHARAAGVPIVVAINKIDMPEANIERVKNGLAEHGLISEAWGGDVQMIEISAREKINIDGLLEAINLQAELLELTANPNRSALGHVVEAQMEKGMGAVATILVQKGTLKVRDYIVAGTEFGRVRALLNPEGKRVKSAGPSTPVSILGLSGVPSAGDEFAVVSSEADAKKLIDNRKDIERRKRDKGGGMSLEDVYRRMKEGDIKELNLIIKADVQGSIEALKKVFAEIEVRETRVKVLHAAVGGITEGDITLADASGAIVLGFGVRPDTKARDAADATGVEVRTYRVIYEAVDDVKAALVGLLDPEFVEKVQGHAEVRETFKIPKLGMIAGVSVQDGKLGRNQKVRLLRDSVVLWEGNLGSLRRFKDDVKEVLQGYECGVGLDGYDDLKVGDVIETYIVEEIRPTA
jgi:translation initiation factor IF-2